MRSYSGYDTVSQIHLRRFYGIFNSADLESAWVPLLELTPELNYPHACNTPDLTVEND